MSIAIATPMYGNMCTAMYHKSLLRLVQQFERIEYPYDVMTGLNESLIERARNNMAEDFLKSRFQKLLFIDADIEFEPDDVAKLTQLDARVAAGVYTCKKPGEDMFAAWHKGKLVNNLDELDEVIDADYAGTGFMMIDRSVFEEMQDKMPELFNDGDPTEKWGYFDRMRVDGVKLSEDYAFCYRCKILGIPIKMHTGVRLIHHGTYPYGKVHK